MEEREIFSSGHVVKVVEAPQSFHVALNSVQFPGPTVESPVPAPAPASAPVVTSGSTDGKKKRGRPRKYGPDGKLALSPMPISASIPLTGDFSSWKRGRGKPYESIKKSFKFYEVEGQGAGPGDGIAYSVGANFTPHILTVNAGEDVTMKIMSFSQQGCRAICILSANGTISNVTLRQPSSSGGTLTYEGRFEILSLTGSYMPTENGFTRSRSGGMSISLASPDGRVMGGGLAGLLVAAGPVQVVVASFLPGHQLEQKPKKPRVEPISMVAPTHVNPTSAEEIRIGTGGVKPIMTPTAFQVENLFSNGQGSRSSPSDDETSFPENESNPSHADAGVVC
ncbi:AT-hook motif nuclear-localized protein 6 [Cajanus cajan]|uniref:AT-hook motif nuclear-localized protein n=1 Tax=Cajanus cajan TaxID=3821 RepID=A0A151T473_CAJCA|nr:AT-hook motif nuclear-localized protein 6 [Cajanus cajan]KYP61852.1 Putative DNA-binding protein ESCAROLA [Cajanus cajan]